jgi:hypothetical protein
MAFAPNPRGLDWPSHECAPVKGSAIGQGGDSIAVQILGHDLLSKKMSRAILPQLSFWRDPFSV